MSFQYIKSFLCYALVLLSFAAVSPAMAQKTCATAGMPSNCVEVWPGQNGPGFEFNSQHGVYLFRDLSNANHYFLLMGNITCDKTCTVFGFQAGNPSVDARTIFDLNGYTITYSAGNYPSIPNNGFENWTGGSPDSWTVLSGSVEQRSTAYWQPMNGASVLYTPGAVSLQSSLIQLPAGRAYQAYVTVGRAASTDITLSVLREDGTVMCSQTQAGYFRGQSFSCRFDPTSSARYRLRLTTVGNAYFDRTGIVPLNDHGVGVFTAWSLNPGNVYHPAIVENFPGLSLPASGDYANPTRLNLLEVKDGTIRAGHENQISYGVYLSGTTDLDLHHTTIEANGLKSHSVSAGGEIHENTLTVNMPWYFARENSEEENVILHGGKFYNNTATGGQGVIRLGGTGTEIYGNLIRNNAQATNHYAIIHSGAVNPKIYNNVFDPIEGSGILTYVGHGYRIYGNTFHVRTATCNVEYLDEDYSTNGIRMNDYGAGTSYDNWVYDNTFYITGAFTETAWPNCMPITTGIFYSASGPGNRVFGNNFYVTKTTALDRAPVFALYLGGAANNPADNVLFYNNLFETNDKAIWVSSPYGTVSNMWIEKNTFRRTANTYYTPPSPASALRLGYYTAQAPGLMLINNIFEGGFNSDSYYYTASSNSATYDLAKKWYLHVTVRGTDGNLAANALVRATSASNQVTEAYTDSNGAALLKLTQYVESGILTSAGPHTRTASSPYSLSVQLGGANATRSPITMDQEQSISVNLSGDSVAPAAPSGLRLGP